MNFQLFISFVPQNMIYKKLCHIIGSTDKLLSIHSCEINWEASTYPRIRKPHKQIFLVSTLKWKKNLYYFFSLQWKLGVQIHVDCQSTIKKGDTVRLKGILHFHHSIKYLKWQKYQNGKFVDINIHNLRYRGSTNALQNPELVINDVDTEDAVKYRIEVQTTESTEYSNEGYVKIIPGTGNFLSAFILS